MGITAPYKGLYPKYIFFCTGIHTRCTGLHSGLISLCGLSTFHQEHPDLQKILVTVLPSKPGQMAICSQTGQPASGFAKLFPFLSHKIRAGTAGFPQTFRVIPDRLCRYVS